MYLDKKILGIIPARGGSKGVVRKNLREVGGKPLICWTIEEAKKSKYLDQLILSSEDKEIIEVAKKWGCEVPFVRPVKYAQDESGAIDTVLHAIKKLPRYNYIVLLQPTSPFRLVEDIDKCIELCLNNKANAAVSVTEPDKHPYWMYRVNEPSKAMTSLIHNELIDRRQDLPKVYGLNGAVYVANCQWLKTSKSFLTPETLAFEMPKERSIDIDTELDVFVADCLIRRDNFRPGS
jgi:CMP-N,N'-diacetyllegionaminic acid synthase